MKESLNNGILMLYVCWLYKGMEPCLANYQVKKNSTYNEPNYLYSFLTMINFKLYKCYTTLNNNNFYLQLSS